MSRTWERTTAEGDTITLTVDAVGFALSVRHIAGGLDVSTASLDAFEEEWAPWLAGPFDDVIDEIREAVDSAGQAADRDDDEVP